MQSAYFRAMENTAINFIIKLRKVKVVIFYFFGFAFNSFAQEFQIGLIYNAQRTSSTMMSNNIRPAYLSWGTNTSYGVEISRTFPKFHYHISYRRGKLINSYDIYRYSPSFTLPERRQNSNFKALKWNSNFFEGAVSILSNNPNASLPIYFTCGLVLCRGQLNYENFPDKILYDDTQFIEVKASGQDAVINYELFNNWVRAWGVNMVFGLSTIKTITKRISLKSYIGVNSGLIPVLSTIVKYNMKVENVRGLEFGQFSSTSYNSGFEGRIQINYRLQNGSGERK
jgi:hypothetical protein